MSSDESLKPRKEAHDEKYESTVLDFLDKEIAAAQPLKDQKDQSEDLDALVSDLMKQVITESNQPEEPPLILNQPTSPKPPEQSKTVRETVGESREKARITPVIESQASKKSKPEQPKPARPKTERPPEKTPAVPAAVLASSHAKPRWVIPAVAAASLCLLASIGVVIHYSGSSAKAPATQAAPKSPAASMPAPTATQAKPQTAAPAATTPQTPASVSNRLEPAASSSKPMQAEAKPAPAQKPVNPAKTPEVSASIPAPPVNKAAESKPGQSEKLQNPPAAVASANVAPPATPTIVESAPAPAPAPAPPETMSLASANGERSPEKPLAPITSQVASFSSPVVPAGPNARQMIPSTPISQTSPSYPELAMRTHAAGTVVLDLEIDEQGKVVKATPLSGPAIFYSAAVNAALKWRYKPASIGGTNIKSQSRVTMVFNSR